MKGLHAPRMACCYVATCLFFLCVPVARAQPELASRGDDSTGRVRLDEYVDYVFPKAPTAGRASILERRELERGELVAYTAFDGASYTLRAYTGRYVLLLLPDSWLGTDGLNEHLVQTFVDRLDLLYQAFTDLVGEEPGRGSNPPGTDLLPVAVVKTCGFGCASIGAKGLELANDPGSLALIKPELEAGHVPQVICHEMGHNFDVFHDYHGYVSDSAHAWTGFVDHYILIYSREGATPDTYAPDRTSGSPDDMLREFVVRKWNRYFDDPSNTWERCLRDELCGPPQELWAGTLYRVAQLHGREAIRGYMRHLGAYKVANPPPSSKEAKNDLHVEALAAGIGSNIDCYVDAWRWSASPAARARMLATYGASSALCNDADGDGSSLLVGDCDDHDSSKHPGQDEVTNGADDECNGVVDDVPVIEVAGGDFPVPQNVSFPSKILGVISAGDTDSFRIPLSTGPLRIRFCAPDDFAGTASVEDPARHYRGLVYVGQISGVPCGEGVFDIDSPGDWTVTAREDAGFIGSYSLEFADSQPWPIAAWASTPAPLFSAGIYRLTVNPSPLAAGTERPSSVRFWVSGLGVVGSAPYGEEASLTWTPPAGIVGTEVSYRAQALVGEIPVTDFTTPLTFRVFGYVARAPVQRIPRPRTPRDVPR